MTTEKHKSVMVVEDDLDLLDLIAVILTEEGYRVVPATDGRDALAKVAKEMPALILLDVWMPVMDGPEFLARFRRMYDHATPIVLLTAAEEGRIADAEIQAEGHLSKPFDLDELLRCVAVYVSENPGSGGGMRPSAEALESQNDEMV
ncbi:MAG: response regulator [Chloroflexi bacterium]|nr:response regulator [Chloroflexota bacterium]